MAFLTREGAIDQTILHTLNQLHQPNPEVQDYSQAMWRAFSEIWVNSDWTGFEWALVEKIVLANIGEGANA